MAQMYGIGAPWSYEGNKKINKYTVCTQPQSPCLTVKPPFANDHYRYACRLYIYILLCIYIYIYIYIYIINVF